MRQQRIERPLTTALGWRLPRWLLDYGPVAFIAFEGLVEVAVHTPHPTNSLALLVGLVINCTALVLRHRAPLVTLAVTLGVAIALGYSSIVLLPVLLGVFNVAEYESRARVRWAAAVAAVTLIATPLIQGGRVTLPRVFSQVVAVGLAVAVGLYLRTRADYVDGLRERAERVERERELLAQQAVADERVRIARELHDVVAHNVSLMVVQAQALAATSAGDSNANETLGRVANLGREALSEMRRMLGVLRVQNGGSPELEPQPGVRDLSSLIEHTREAGLDATLTISGEQRELSPGVDLSAYRIVQEALTNVIKHAAARHAAVTLTFAPEALEVTITDDGRGIRGSEAQTTNGTEAGHGLVGMRERVALFGGALETTNGPTGRGYSVRAVLPVH